MKEKDITIKNQMKLSLPMAFEQLVNVLMTTIDTLVIGFLGSSAVAQLGAMGTVLNLLFVFPITIMVTINVLVANLIGEQNYKKIELMLGNSLILGIIVSIILIILSMIVSPFLPNIFKVSNTCLIYLYIRLLGFIPLTIVNILSGYERTCGNPSLVLKVKVISLIINLLLDILVVKLGFGIAGVGLVTILIDIILMVYFLIRNKSKIIFKFNRECFKTIYYYSKWNCVERFIYKIDIFLMNVIVSNISTIIYSVHVILSQLTDVYREFISGIQNGITVNVGIIFGSKKNELFKKLREITNKIQLIISITAPVLITIISVIICKIYFKENIQVEVFYKLLLIVIINSIINAIAIYYYAYLRGVKDFKFLANRNIISSVIKVIMAFILAKYFGIIGVWLSYFIYSVSQYIMSKRRYEKIKV